MKKCKNTSIIHIKRGIHIQEPEHSEPNLAMPDSIKIKPVFQLNSQVSRMKTSATLEMSRIVRLYRSQGRNVVNFGLGQSPFGAPPIVQRALSDNADKTDYLPTEGILELRKQISEFYKRYFEFKPRLDQIVIGPGSKELLFLSMAALDCSWLFVSPSWVTYETQSKLLGKSSWRLFLSNEDDFRVTEKSLRKKLRQIDDKLEGKTLAMLINYPNNPTGITLSKQEIKRIARFARNNEIIILSDEIYGNIVHSSFGEKHHSMALEYPEGTIVTGGTSKDRSMGGYRFGVAILPDDEPNLVQAFKSIGSETYSSVAAPIQHAAKTAYSDNKEIDDHIISSTAIHEIVGNVVYDGLKKAGYQLSKPEGAFYLFPSLNKYEEEINNKNIYSSKDLVRDLILNYNVAVIAGTAFGLRPDDLTFRMAYIDYQGPRVLETYRKNPDKAMNNPRVFVEENCPNVIKGIKLLKNFVQDLS